MQELSAYFSFSTHPEQVLAPEQVRVPVWVWVRAPVPAPEQVPEQVRAPV